MVSVVIINYNSGAYIFDCLAAIEKQTHPLYEVLILDNKSEDGSSKRLEAISADKGYRYWRFDDNLGSAKANNFGIFNSRGEYVLILNADVFLTPAYIEKCVLVFNKDKSIGTVAGKLLSSRDHRIIDSAGIVLYKEGLGCDRGKGEFDEGQFEKEEYVAGACCAAAVYRKEMLRDLEYGEEYYDNNFFSFQEDVDLSIQSLLLDWKTLYVPEAVAYHVRGGSTKNVSRFANYLSLRNEEFLYYKYFRPAKIGPVLLRKILTLIRVFRFGRGIFRQIHKELEGKRGVFDQRLKHFAQKIDYSNLHYFTAESRLMYKLRRFIYPAQKNHAGAK